MRLCSGNRKAKQNISQINQQRRTRWNGNATLIPCREWEVNMHSWNQKSGGYWIVTSCKHICTAIGQELRAIGLFFIGLVILIILIAVFSPAIGFKRPATNPKTHDKTDERDCAEDAECESFALRLDLGGQGEETAGEERSHGAPGRREGLCETIQCTEDSVVRCGVRDLESVSIK